MENKNYTINDEYNLSPANEEIQDSLNIALDSYDSPAQGFKTSFVADSLKTAGFNVMDVYDKELESAPDNLVY